MMIEQIWSLGCEDGGHGLVEVLEQVCRSLKSGGSGSKGEEMEPEKMNLHEKSLGMKSGIGLKFPSEHGKSQQRQSEI
jgi:hypothetical protein